MNPSDYIHKSWEPLRYLLYEPKLTELRENVLPNISYKPPRQKIFRAFSMPLTDIKVVILGQDPYPGGLDACGYAFVNGTDKIPASLRIIYKELTESGASTEPSIRTWPDQGVFLLNTALTVEAGKPDSHAKYWSDFTTQVIRFIASRQPCIWLLWGSRAKRYASYLGQAEELTYRLPDTIRQVPLSPEKNYFMLAPHPMVEVYQKTEHEFYGCDHFTITNTLLELLGKPKINW